MLICPQHTSVAVSIPKRLFAGSAAHRRGKHAARGCAVERCADRQLHGRIREKEPGEKREKKSYLHLYQFRKELLHRFCHRIRQRPRGINCAGNFHHEFMDQAVKRPLPHRPCSASAPYPPVLSQTIALIDCAWVSLSARRAYHSQESRVWGLRRRWRTLQTDGTQLCQRIIRVVASPAPRLKSMSARY